MHGWLSREVKTLYKTLGTSPLTFEQLETVVIDIKKHLNNLLLTHVKSREGELETLMQYVLMWGGGNAREFADIEIEEEEVTRPNRRLNYSREIAWRRWQREFVNSLMQNHRRETTRNNKLLRLEKSSLWRENRRTGESGCKVERPLT